MMLVPRILSSASLTTCLSPASRLTRTLSSSSAQMPSCTFSLKAVFFVTTVCVVGVLALLRILPIENTWKSGLSDSEIQSAIVHYSVFGNDTNTHTLTKKESIRFIRLAESCPTRGFYQRSPQHIPRPDNQDTCIVELKLSRNRKLSISLIFNDLMIERETLIDIDSKDDKIRPLLWPSG